MALDRDTRAEMLRSGDHVRWLGEWHLVTRVQIDPWSVLLWLDQGDGITRVVFYRPGWLLAANCRPRDEAAA